MFIRKSSELSSCHVQLILEVGTLSMKYSKTLYFFERAPRRFLFFGLKSAMFIRGGALSIKCNTEDVVFFERAPRRLFLSVFY